ncbi:vitamin B12 ABC transporter ATP-binding protein BtuD [Pantoea sp. BIGb0393]|uniref:Vitamin B12 import ATP-binding protein BtuD n=1 Tax=Pantoea nemavictus TaxID=2726955 RepID=A0ABU8PWL8_9GAMM|nr:vitamin B12 ABC transporter ATP-binding protein BtuD [Pantoea nemavictus]MBA0038126.1 vitamin B12 ABC transporter ATP-binding protein BtuD [Pantoea nemavictus]
MVLQCHGASVSGRLAPVELCVNAGELVHLVGPNGAGKSTLLAMLSGLLPSQGSMLIGGTALAALSGAALAQLRGWLPQQQMAPGQMPVWHYLRMHIALLTAETDDVFQDVLAQLGLQDKLTRSVTQLSGGEWQRVRLAAVVLQVHPALNPRGKLLLLDEPMSALDVAQQRAVDKLLAELCRSGLAIVASGHDLNHSLRHADRVWLMHRGEVVKQGRASAVLTAAQLAPLYQTPFEQIDTAQGPLLFIP